MKRRSFLAKLLGSLALVGGSGASCGNDMGNPAEKGFPVIHKSKKTSTVALVRSRSIVEKGKMTLPDARAMLFKGVAEITGEKDDAGAWKSLFRKEDKVGIKVNTLAGPNLSPSPLTVQAVIEGLRLAGVAEENIIVWDRSTRELERAGFTPNIGGRGVLYAGTGNAYNAEPETAGSVGSCFSRILTDFCTALINVGVLKDHDLSGVSVCMKNFFGAIHNPNKYHDNNCDPYIADINTYPHIKNKLRLSLCDAFRAQYDGGPSFKSHFSWIYGGYLLGLDQVAIDSAGRDIIEAKRKEKELKSLKEAGREPKWIRTAEERGLGNADPSRIDLLEIEV